MHGGWGSSGSAIIVRIIDDLALKRLEATETSDFYEIVVDGTAAPLL